MGYFDRFNSKGIPFMDNRDKGDLRDILGKTVHIEDFGFIKSEEGGDYGVIAIQEDKEKFFFVNSVITDMLHQVDSDGMRDELPKQCIVFSMAESKKGREYFKFEFTENNIPF